MHFARGEALRVACDDVAAQTGGEGGAELGGRTGAGLLEEWRDGGGVRKDIACEKVGFVQLTLERTALRVED